MYLSQSPQTDKTKDNIKPTLYSKILDLRNIQLELKCESQAKNFNKKEKEDFENDLNDELATMILNRKMYFIYFMLSINNNQEYLLSPFINSLFKDVAIKDPTPLTYDIYDGGIDFNFSELTSTDEKLQDFAKKCVYYAKKHSNEIDKLTFSVIPGLFEYFWCNEVNYKFRDFIEFALKEDRDIATKFNRVIFASTELFYCVFDLFINNDSQIPKFINKMDTLKNNLPDVEICTDIFNMKTNLKKNRKNNLSSTLNYTKVSEVIDISDKLFFFTESDVEIITSIINPEEQPTSTNNQNNDLTIYHFPPPYHETNDIRMMHNSTRSTSAPFSKYKFPNTALKAVSLKGYPINKTKEDLNNFSMIYSESFNMSYLRKLLVKFPTIQIIAPNNIDDIRVSTILANQVCLARDEDRLLFEKQIENLKKIEKEDGNELEWKITPITQKLREGFQERRSNFEKTISEISKIQDLITKVENLTTKVQKESVKFREKIESKVIKIWEKTNQFSASTKNFQKLPKISKSPKDNIKTKANYTSIWENIINDFHEWLSTNDYSIKFNIYLLHDDLLSFYSFTDYINEKDVAKKEAEFCQLIKKQKTEIVQFCNSGHKESVSKEDFLSNAFFKEKLTNLLNTALNEQTPARQVLAFSDLFKLINSVFAQIYTDFSYDDVVKFFILFIISSEKDAGRLKSSFDYISSFLWFDDQNNLNEEIFENNSDASKTFKYISYTISIIENPDKYQ